MSADQSMGRSGHAGPPSSQGVPTPTETQAPSDAGSDRSPEPPRLDPDLIAPLVQDLAEARWTVDRADRLLSQAARDAMMRDQRVPALAELREDPVATDPAALLTRLFVLGSTEEGTDVDDALPLTGADGLEALGLAAVEDGLVTALFDLRPHTADLPSGARDWWVASDLGEAVTGRPLRPDHVLGIGGATLTLLELTVRDYVASALDIGTGCGIQALYLAEHADRVIATDLSERACALTRFNAALNGADIDVREGSLFEPVTRPDGAPERFDLIVSNPPFVITPDSVRAQGPRSGGGGTGGVLSADEGEGGPAGPGGLLEYRDGGMARDSLIATILREAPGHLAEGGVLQMLANWEIPAGVDPDTGWWRRVDRWLDGLPVDAWVVQRDVLDPARYVEMWLRDSGGTLTPRGQWERLYADWLADFRAAGVGAIGMGFVALRRSAGADGTASEDRGETGGPGHAGTPSSEPEGEEPISRKKGTELGGARVYTEELDGRTPRGVDVARALATLRLPVSLDGLRLRRAADVTEERHYTPGEPDPRVLVLHQGAGLGRSFPVGTAVSGLVGASDGELAVGQILTAIAVLTDQDAGELRRQVDAPLRDLIRAGVLEIVGEG